MPDHLQALRAEVERLKITLEFTRQRNRELTVENKRLREGRGLLPPDPLDVPVEIKVPKAMLPPPGPIVVPVHPALLPPPPTESSRRQARRRVRSYAYEGELPLRTQWPLISETS